MYRVLGHQKIEGIGDNFLEQNKVVKPDSFFYNIWNLNLMEGLLFAKAIKKGRDFIKNSIEVDLRYTILQEMEKFSGKITKGQSIAITAGSRGIKNISLILRTICDFFKKKGAHPFIISSMGSHGGGSIEGQRQILDGLGITEEKMAVPIEISDEPELVGVTKEGYKFYVDPLALRADGIFVVNRVKPHTVLRREIGSGLLKMLAVGLGKKRGAEEVHSFGPENLEKVILSLALLSLERLNIIGGLVIIEDEDKIAHIESIQREEFLEKEKQLFEISKRLLPSLPFCELDLLIILEMGKNISGTGIDTNVIGRMRIEGVEEPERPKIKRVVVLRLSPNSYGNANGIGLADFTTKRLVESIDWQKTLTNAISTGYLRRVFCPPFLETEREAILWAIKSLKKDPSKAMASIIKNTGELNTLWLSEEAFKITEDYERVSTFEPLKFDGEGNLILE